MSWVDGHFKDHERAEKESAKVRLRAEQLYDELWKEITDRVMDARNGGMLVSTNGSSYERVVLLGGAVMLRPFSEAKQLTITLEDRRKIVVTWEDGTIEIPLRVRPDGVVCLTHQARELTIPEAAKLILEPFLFPPRP